MPQPLFELYPGFMAFSCAKLHASLSVTACADNWKNRKCISCVGCAIGAEHAGAPPDKAPASNASCCRCGRTDLRLVGKVLCVSRFNRTQEARRGRVRRGYFPSVIARRLQEAVAILAIDHAEDALRQLVRGTRLHAGAHEMRPTVCAHGPGLPTFSVLDKGHIWLSAVTSGPEELTRSAQRLLPDCRIIDMEFLPTFSELRASRDISL
jgi:hypothetical protein